MITFSRAAGIKISHFLFSKSEESEKITGLNLLEGSVKKLTKIDENYIDRIPNIGWRNNFVESNNKFLQDNLDNYNGWID